MNGMVHRLIPVVLALVVGSAPVAREVCEVACTDHHAAARSSHVHQDAAGHAMAGHAVATQDMSHAVARDATATTSDAAMACGEVTMASPRDRCAHDAAFQVVPAAAAKLVVHAPAEIPLGLDGTRPHAPFTASAAFAASAALPAPLALRTPLRI